MIYIYNEDRLCETDSLRQALKLETEGIRGQRPVVSAVGAGGKTTTLHRLADEYVRAGIPVIVTTTTHIMKEDREWFLSGLLEEKIRKQLQKAGQVWIGAPAPGGKLARLSDHEIEKLLRWEVPLLIHEPVILPETTHVLSVYGLDSVGKRIEETVFRPELAEKLLNKKRTECVTAEDIAVLAAARSAGRKGCPGSAVYTVVLNKADDKRRIDTALEICRELRKRGIRQVIVTGQESGAQRAGTI